MIDSIKSFLYKTLGLHQYLQLIQNGFIIGYTSGILKWDEKYRWHYFIKKLIKPEDTIIDIGANLGYFSLTFSKLINQQGSLYCVEPVKPYRKLLEKKIIKKPNVFILSFALGAENKDCINLGMPPMLRHIKYLRHGTVTVLSKEKTAEGQLLFESPMRKAGEVFSSLAKVDYIKCDIEGYETVVIPEMKEVLIKHKPLVQLETWGEQLPIMLQFFEEIRFEPYHLKKGQLYQAKNLDLQTISSSDILFVHPDKKIKIQPFLA
ncbi:MAG: FkbM family methyltransferase [Bacteroidetes bacterium]|nr:FkbM family methyltransferase [Bacteroidota bacterium]